MLSHNYRHFLKQSQGLKDDFHRAAEQPYSSSERLKNASHQMLVVRLQDYWGQFVRRLIVLSASGLATTLSGQNVISGLGFSNILSVEHWINQQKRGRREPDWHVSQISVDFAQKLSVSNLMDVSAALGSTNSPEKEVRNFRNFIVHRNQETASRLKTQNRILGYTPRSLHLVPTEYSTGGQMVFDRWISEFQLVAKIASR